MVAAKATTAGAAFKLFTQSIQRQKSHLAMTISLVL